MTQAPEITPRRVTTALAARARAARWGDRLAGITVPIWLIAAWQGRAVGIWYAVGGAAFLLAAIASAVEGRALAGSGTHGRALRTGLLAGFVMAVATIALFPPLAAVVPALRDDTVGLYRLFGEFGVAIAAMALPGVVVCEEIVWRGMVQQALTRRFGTGPAVVGGTMIYALAHAPIGSPTLVFACVGLGLGWSLLRARTGSLAAAVAAHITWDVVVLLVWPLVPAAA